jgi:uncharacterized protein YnzC (UPF0291/DUF896 family)
VRNLRLLAFACALSALLIPAARTAAAQASATGSVELNAYVRASQAQPEPVRGMTFFLLSRSLSDIRKEVATADSMVDLDHFVAQLDVSAELKDWISKHRRVDLAGTDFTKEVSPDDVVKVPEFLTAYTSQNGAALHAVIPEPKYKKGEEQKNPEKYKEDREQYRQALRRYIQANLDSIEGIDAELRDVNPYPRWAKVQGEQQRHLEKRVMQLAQTHYLVAMAVSNLSGSAAFDNVPAGQYWITNLDIPALAGDLRLHWDVAISVPPAKTARIELSNLNAVETSEQNAQ